MLSATISEQLKQTDPGHSYFVVGTAMCFEFKVHWSEPKMSSPTVIDKAVVPGAHRVRCWSSNDSRAAVVP